MAKYIFNKKNLKKKVIISSAILALGLTTLGINIRSCYHKQNYTPKPAASSQELSQKLEVKAIFPDQNSIVDYLKSRDLSSNIEFRNDLYKTLFGIDAPYSGKAEQNIRLLREIKKYSTESLMEKVKAGPVYEIIKKEAPAPKIDDVVSTITSYESGKIVDKKIQTPNLEEATKPDTKVLDEGVKPDTLVLNESTKTDTITLDEIVNTDTLLFTSRPDSSQIKLKKHTTSEHIGNEILLNFPHWKEYSAANKAWRYNVIETQITPTLEKYFPSIALNESAKPDTTLVQKAGIIKYQISDYSTVYDFAQTTAGLKIGQFGDFTDIWAPKLDNTARIFNDPSIPRVHQELSSEYEIINPEQFKKDVEELRKKNAYPIGIYLPERADQPNNINTLDKILFQYNPSSGNRAESWKIDWFENPYSRAVIGEQVKSAAKVLLFLVPTFNNPGTPVTPISVPPGPGPIMP